jgi:hypothetical protein
MKAPGDKVTFASVNKLSGAGQTGKEGRNLRLGGGNAARSLHG